MYDRALVFNSNKLLFKKKERNSLKGVIRRLKFHNACGQAKKV